MSKKTFVIYKTRFVFPGKGSVYKYRTGQKEAEMSWKYRRRYLEWVSAQEESIQAVTDTSLFLDP